MERAGWKWVSTNEPQPEVPHLLFIVCHSCSAWICCWMINPFTAPACKMSELKGAQIHAPKLYVWWSCNKSTFNTVLIDRSPFTCSHEGEKTTKLMVSNLALLLVFSEWRCDTYGSERVKWSMMDSTYTLYECILTVLSVSPPPLPLIYSGSFLLSAPWADRRWGTRNVLFIMIDAIIITVNSAIVRS